MFTTTPRSVTASVSKFCHTIRSDVPPVDVPVRPIYGEKLDDCVDVVARKVDRDGGSAQLGWTIWEFPYTWLEAEFHAVWVSPAGELVDVSPKASGEKRILFLADDDLTYTPGEKAPSNRMFKLREHKLIDEAIDLLAKRNEWSPKPGETIKYPAHHPLVGVLNRLKVVMPQLGMMAQTRIDSRRRRSA